jgi:hypothetical protein
MASKAIKILSEMKIEHELLAQKCSRAIKELERVEGSVPASRKGNHLKAQVIEITTSRRRNLLKKRIK